MRISETLKKNKKNFIIYAILWLIAVIVFVMPISAAIVESTVDGVCNIETCLNLSMEYIQAPLSTLGKVFLERYISTFFNALWKFTVGCLILAIIGTVRNASKSEYENIEHGSSDWSKNGEQYKILSRAKGILLAEDNYLPLDKRGNTNVLVVGRFWFW